MISIHLSIQLNSFTTMTHLILENFHVPQKSACLLKKYSTSGGKPTPNQQYCVLQREGMEKGPQQ